MSQFGKSKILPLDMPEREIKRVTDRTMLSRKPGKQRRELLLESPRETLPSLRDLVYIP